MSERFLIVDDDADSANLTFRHLHMSFPDAEIREVETGQAALEALQHQEFAAIITDYRMPAMNGITLIREIRKLDAHVPIVLKTAMEDMEPAAIEAGANHVLPWFRWDELGDILRELLHCTHRTP